MASSVTARRSERVPGAPGDHQLRKAIIPVAGLGTRLLPATKALPKGMLPLIDRPAVQYVVEEAAAAGLADVVLVTGADSGAFMAYFDSADQLERVLAERGHGEMIADLRAATELPVACIEQD